MSTHYSNTIRSYCLNVLNNCAKKKLVIVTPSRSLASKSKKKVYTISDAPGLKKPPNTTKKTYNPVKTESNDDYIVPCPEGHQQDILNSYIDNPILDEEIQALVNKMETVEKAIFEGKKVKTSFICKLMISCIKRNQFNLANHLFVLFDEGYYLEEDKGSEVDGYQNYIDLNENDSQLGDIPEHIHVPVPSYETYILALYSAAASGDGELVTNILQLLSAEQFTDYESYNINLDFIHDFDKSIWKRCSPTPELIDFQSAIIMENQARKSTIKYMKMNNPSDVSSDMPLPVCHVASYIYLLYLLNSEILDPTNGEATAISGAVENLVAFVEDGFIPTPQMVALVHNAMYAIGDVGSVHSFFSKLGNASPYVSPDSETLQLLLKNAVYYDERLHALTIFDCFQAYCNVDVAEGTFPEGVVPGSYQSLGYLMNMANQIGISLWNKMMDVRESQMATSTSSSSNSCSNSSTEDLPDQWLQLNGQLQTEDWFDEHGLFSKAGAQLMPLTHNCVYASTSGQRRIVDVRVYDEDGNYSVVSPFSPQNTTTFPPTLECIKMAMQVCRGYPLAMWESVGSPSPAMWRETIILSELLDVLGQHNEQKYILSLGAQTCMNANKTGALVFLLERLLRRNAPVRIRLTSDVLTYLADKNLPLSMYSLDDAAQSISAVPTDTPLRRNLSNNETEDQDVTVDWETLPTPPNTQFIPNKLRHCSKYIRDSGAMAVSMLVSSLREPIHPELHDLRLKHGFTSPYYFNHHSDFQTFIDDEYEPRPLTSQAIQGFFQLLISSGRAPLAAGILTYIHDIDVNQWFTADVAAILTQVHQNPQLIDLMNELRYAHIQGINSAGVLHSPNIPVNFWDPTDNYITSPASPSFCVNRAETERNYWDVRKCERAFVLHPHINTLDLHWDKSIWGELVSTLGLSTDVFYPCLDVNDLSLNINPEVLARMSLQLWAVSQSLVTPILPTFISHLGVISGTSRLLDCPRLLESLNEALLPQLQDHQPCVEDASETLPSQPKSKKRNRNNTKDIFQLTYDALKDKHSKAAFNVNVATSVGSGHFGTRSQIQHIYQRVLEYMYRSHITDDPLIFPPALVNNLYRIAALRFNWPMVDNTNTILDVSNSYSDVMNTVKQPLCSPLGANGYSELSLKQIASIPLTEYSSDQIPIIDWRRSPISLCSLELDNISLHYNSLTFGVLVDKIQWVNQLALISETVHADNVIDLLKTRGYNTEQTHELDSNPASSIVIIAKK